MATKTSTPNSEQNINTVASMGQPNDDARIDLERKTLASQFAKEKKVKRKINKSFQSVLGTTHFIAINGVSLVLPVDGSDFELPETFAEHLDKQMAEITL